MPEEQINATIPAGFQKFYTEYNICHDWVENCGLTLRSRRSVRDYAESVAQFLEYIEKDPLTLSKSSYDEATAMMKQFVLWRNREVGVSPKTVNRQWSALVSFFRFCGVKGEYRFPSKNIPMTVKYLDKIPTREELWDILQAPKLDLPARIAIHLIAYAGIRPDDIVKLTYDCIKTDLNKIIPCVVYVPQGKTGNVYATFIPGETVRQLIQYFENRRQDGETIADSSPIILDHREFTSSGRIKGVQRKNICRKITEAIRNSGIETKETFAGKVRRMRPYGLRKYFRSNLTGHAPSEYIEAWLGHTSGLKHVYGGTRDMDPSTIERMREAYKKCEPFLVATSQPFERSDIVEEAKIEAVKAMAKSVFGIDLAEVKIARERQLGMELSRSEELALYDAELQKLRVGLTGKKTPQRLVNHLTVEHEIAEELDKANITYDREFPLFGETFDFVIPSTGPRAGIDRSWRSGREARGPRFKPPKVVVEALPFRTPNLASLKLNAFMAADLKKKIKGVKVVLVLGGITRGKLPAAVSKYEKHFDAVFTDGEIQKFRDYVRKYAKRTGQT
jgi:integrase